MARLKTWVIYNPEASQGRLGQEWPKLEAQLRTAFGARSFEVVATTAEDTGEGLTRDALQAGANQIVVVGGDGTVSNAAAGFVDRETEKPISGAATLVVVPYGRGNDFFKALVPERFRAGKSAWEQGLALITEGRSRLADLGVVEYLGEAGVLDKRFFVNVASFGFSGKVVNEFHHPKGWLANPFVKKFGGGKVTYVLHSLSALMEYKGLMFRISVDGEEVFHGRLHMGLVMNGWRNGGGMRWSRDAVLDDGLFHLLALEQAESAADLALRVPMMLARTTTGDWRSMPGAKLALGRVVEAVWADPERDPKAKPHPLFEVDGDQDEPKDAVGARFRVLPGAIRVLRL